MIETIDQLPIVLRMIISLIVVIALMGGLALIVKKLGLANIAQVTEGDHKRLSVLERLPLDPRRQLVLIKRDEAEHLVILGLDGETLVETNIQNGKRKITAKKKTSKAKKDKAT